LRYGFIRVERGCVAVADVVGALGAVGGCERGLHLEVVPEELQDGPHEILLRLSLVGARRERGEDGRYLLHHRMRPLHEGLPIRSSWQRYVQVVIGEQPMVAVGSLCWLGWNRHEISIM